jgi:hypothetical protein
MAQVKFSPQSTKIGSPLSKLPELPIEKLRPKGIEGSLQINSKSSLAPSEARARDSVSLSRREQVESRASNSLLNASQNLSKKEALTSSLLEVVKSVQSLTSELENEVNPLRQSKLKEDIQAQIDQAEESFQRAINDDPNLMTQGSFTVPVFNNKEEVTTGQIKTITISAAFSPNDVGITSLDTSDIESLKATLADARSSLNSKQSELESSRTEITGSVKDKIQELELERDTSVDEISIRTEELAKQITSSTDKFIIQNSIDSSKIEDILPQSSNREEVE